MAGHVSRRLPVMPPRGGNSVEPVRGFAAGLGVALAISMVLWAVIAAVVVAH